MREKPRREELFPTDGPVPPDQMIGRTEDVSRIASSLAAGQSLRVLAPRRTGKTTACEAALARLREEGWYVASVDLMDPSGAMGLAQDLTRSLLGNRPQMRRALGQARDGWRRLGDRIRTQAMVDLGDGVMIAFSSGLDQEDPDAALRDALALPQRLAEKDGCPVVVFLDELQELAAASAPFGDPVRLQGRMRAIFQRSGQVSLLFAGSLEHAMQQVFRPDAPLGGYGGSYALSEIGPDEWESGLADRFSQGGIGVRSAALQRIVELGDGHPRATMLVAAEAYTTVREAGVGTLDADTVALAWTRARSHDAERCRLLVERMRRLPVAKGKDLPLRLARSVAADEPPYALTGHSEQIKRALGALADVGVVEQIGRGAWRVPDPILRAHLCQPL
jgi:hypothetical protein